MSTYAEMSYDELTALESSAEYPHDVEYMEIYREQMRKSGAMDAICKLSAELDAEGLVVVPRTLTIEMIDATWYSHEEQQNLWDVLIEASPPPTREA